MKSKLLEYYWKFKETYELGVNLGFGQGQIASKFTESLCRYLFDLEEYDGKEFDASKDNYNIEIKSTLGTGKSITVNLSNKFDYLYWLNLDLCNNKIKVIKYNYKQIEDAVRSKEKNKNTNNRDNLNFNNVKNNLDSFNFQIKENDIKKL